MHITPYSLLLTSRHESSVWGPTCDGLDCVLPSVSLPELSPGDWLYFNNMGAYTMAAGSTFNGMPRPQVHYVIQELHWQTLQHRSRALEDQRRTTQKLEEDKIELEEALLGFVDKGEGDSLGDEEE